MIASLQYIAMATGGIAFVCLIGLIWFYGRTERRERERLRQTKADIADMTILFQTMRDIIKQQKELARDFNTRLDSKMAAVKQVLSQGIERNKELYDKQQALLRQIEETQEQLQSLQRQVAYLREAGVEAPRPAPAPPVPPPAKAPVAAMPPVNPVPLRVTPAISPEPPAVSFPRANPAAVQAHVPAAFADWADFDNEGVEAAVEPEEEPFEVPEAPENPLAARNAFRALLDLEPEIAPLGDPLNDAPGNPVPAPGGNGGLASARITPLQRRVLEYREAGMDVGQIAQELGVGKGEVRLMLSLLRKQ